MSKLTHEWDRDVFGNPVLLLRKARGKISLDESANHLRYDDRLAGHWVIILNASEATCGVGWPIEEPKGDVIELYQIEAENTCPVCARLTPPEYCPHCGEKISEEQ
jgi:hypothetical protein